MKQMRLPSWLRPVSSVPAMQETLVGSLGWEDPLEKEMANPLQYSCLENPYGQRSLADFWGRKELNRTETLSHSDIE